MLNIRCPSCNTRIQTADEHAGTEIACPECNAGVTIPSPDGITASPAAVGASHAGAITTPENVATAGPRRRDHETATSAAAKGMGVGMIVLIVLGVGGCIMLAIVAILVALLVPAVQKVREAAARTQTTNNMMQIGLACHNYEATFKEFPGPKMRGIQMAPFRLPPPGTVELSWRVSILPFIEQNALFQQFDKSAAWDDPKNRAFANSAVKEYQSVWRNPPDPTQTHFQFFTGPNTMFPTPGERVRIADITDGTSNTILFAESQTVAPWSKPQDIVVAPNMPIGVPPDRFLATLADGSVRMFDHRQVNDGVLRMLIDPRDGMVPPPGVLD